MDEHYGKDRDGDAVGNLRLSEYLDIAFRRRWWIGLTTLAVFVCATVVGRRLPNMYRAETVILVNAAQVPDKYVPTVNTGDIAGRLVTLRQQVLSPTRLKKLVESESLYPDPGGRTEDQVVHSVQKSIVVDLVNPAVGQLGSFRIAYISARQAEVARMANQLAQMFIEENLRARVDQTEDTAEFLEEQLQNTKKQLDEKDSQLSTIK